MKCTDPLCMDPHCWDERECPTCGYLWVGCDGCPECDPEPTCTVVTGPGIDDRCGRTPAEPMPETIGTWFDFPMCAEHRHLFRRKPAPERGNK